MTEVKFDPRLTKRILEALEPYSDLMFERKGSRWVAVVEFEAAERTETTETVEDIQYVVPKVKLRIRSLEIAPGQDEHTVRAAQAALHRKRNSKHGKAQLPLDDPDLKFAAGLIGDGR